MGQILQPISQQISIPQPASLERNYGDTLYDIFSIICPPLGVYRFTKYFTGKQVAKIVVPASSRNGIPRAVGEERRGNLTGREITIQSPEGHHLNGFQVQNPGSTKWIVHFGGNLSCYQNQTARIFTLASQFNANVLFVNYRGTFNPFVSGPSCFEDLEKDGRSVIWHLQNQGVDLQRDIVLDGFSLGGAVALATGKAFQIPTVAHNTFASTEAVARSWIDGFRITWARIDQFLQNISMATLTGNLPCSWSILFALKDLLGTPLELVFRVTYFVYAFLHDLWQGEFEKVLIDLKEILKTLILAPIITATAIPALIASLACCTWFHQANAHLNMALRTEESALITALSWSSLAWCAEALLSFSGWSINSVANWNGLRRDKLAFYVPNDAVIRLPASLATATELEGGVRIRHSDQADHMTQDGYVRPEYAGFINRAFGR